MCRSAWCVRTVVDVFSDLLDAVESGQPIQHALCVRVADLMGARASAYIRFDTDAHVCTMTCWPLTLDVARLKVVVEHLPRAFPLLVHHLSHEPKLSCLSEIDGPVTWGERLGDLLLDELLGCRDLAHLPLNIAGSEVRMLVLAREDDFDAREMHLLGALQRPVRALDSILNSRPDRVARYSSDDEVDPGRTAGLTHRELEVLAMLAEGLMARTIATKMRVSPRTVHKHLGSIYRKLDAHDRLVAVNRAQAIGLLPGQREPAHH